MKKIVIQHLPLSISRMMAWPASLFMALHSTQANPTGGSVTQGAAVFNTSGSQFTVTTSGNTLINWSTFNIGGGETTTFVQPSSSSVVWNKINDVNPSQILGTVNANGYVVLQNPSGFYIGGNATISAHNLIMTTAAANGPNLSSGGAWDFNSPPPTAKIVNYGAISLTGGGSGFLIASDIENNGTVSAPGGKVGLYGGQHVLVSLSPDGRGLSAQVTLPQGSVDNEGNLIADAGSIAAQAQMVNQNGLIQANSVKNANGTIELVASENVSLGSSSVLSAQGTGNGTSDGGAIAVKSGGAFSDEVGSSINIAGGATGGNGGQLEISAPNLGPIQSQINGWAGGGYQGGRMLIDPTAITLDAPTEASYNALISSGGLSQFTVSADTITVNQSWTPPASLSELDLIANGNITLNTVWTLPDAANLSTLSLSAGNSLIFNIGSGINAQNNCTLNLNAGTSLAAGATPVHISDGTQYDGIYLLGNAYIQTQNGNINCSAPNEIQVGSGAIRTVGGGNIAATTGYGDVNAGNNVNGYLFGQDAYVVQQDGSPKILYYSVDANNLGGISTAAGGNVSITAGRNVTSYLPIQDDYSDAQNDAGSGAFGYQPGNVSIIAGGNVYGHYVLANGTGMITAGGDIGAPLSTFQNDLTKGFALSLVKGSWAISAPNGNIYVQDIRNPNGIFGEALFSSPDSYDGYHYFDYAPDASVSLNAAGTVEFSGYEEPHLPPSGFGLYLIPLLLPPSLQITTGSGDVVLDTSVILFPSPSQNLNLNIGGNLVGQSSANPYTSGDIPGGQVNFEMSDSQPDRVGYRWVDPFSGGTPSFGTTDHATSPTEFDNPNAAQISVHGNILNINFYFDEQGSISAGGNMNNCGFVGENLHPNDKTSISVNGQIYNSPLYSFVQLSSPIVSANPFQPGAWDSVFSLAVDPTKISGLTSLNANNPPGGNGLAYYLKQKKLLLFTPSGPPSSSGLGVNPGFAYDPSSQELGFKGSMNSLPSSQLAALETGQFTVLAADTHGNPIIDANGHLEVETYHFNAASVISSLYAESLNSVTTSSLGLLIHGRGNFDINAGSMDLGYSPGIISEGFAGDPQLESLTEFGGGASVDVTVLGDINMVTSAIGSFDGGGVKVEAGGQITLSQGEFDFHDSVVYGIYTSGNSDVSVTATGDIFVGNACIATFNGGDVSVTSLNGDVNAGNGNNRVLEVYGTFLSPDGTTELNYFGNSGDVKSLKSDPAPYGSGILAEAETPKYNHGVSGVPGNITVSTPHGNIISGLGGIAQLALDQSFGGESSVTLNAGTPGVAPNDKQGNIQLGGAVIGGSIKVSATGKISGSFVARQDLSVKADSFSGLALAGRQADLTTSESGGPSIVVGVGGINASGLGSSATLLSQNVDTGSGSKSTLATSAATTSASQAAAQESSSDAKQQVASEDESGDLTKNKKNGIIRTKRVTVILPGKSS